MTLTDPSLPLQKSISDRLLASPEFQAVFEGRLFDRIQNNPAFPYSNFGDTQLLPETGEGTDAASSFVTLHVWERFKGFDKVKSGGAIIVKLLHDQDITLPSGQVQSVLLESARYIRDPDGLTSHGILTFEILTDAND